MSQIKFLNANAFVTAYDNSVSPFIPQLWAQESLAILEENMVASALIHRDFQPIIANYGDTINTRRPGQFTAKRKTTTDSVTVQDATANNIQVVLNQHIHTSFLIRDGEESKSFKTLVDEYMAPAMLAQARFIDKVVLGQFAQFMTDANAGGLGTLTNSNAKANILALRQVMNQNKAYLAGRNLIWNPASEATVLSLDQFLQAYSVGDDGTAIREASLGRRLGFDMYLAQNMSNVLKTNLPPSFTGAINNASGYPAGTTGPLTVNNFTGVVTTGAWLTIAGDMTPYRITAHAETTGNTTSITLDRPLRYAVANAALITVYTPAPPAAVVDQPTSPTGYAAGYAKEIAISGLSAGQNPQVGQVVSFGTTAPSTTPPVNGNPVANASPIYTIIDVDSNIGIILDRPLDVAINNNDPVHFGPPGQYNFAFHRNAMALVVRPLAMPRPGTGALAATVNWNDLSMRATITYDGNKQGHLVTLDMLCGIAVLDTNLGAVLFG